MWPKFFFFEKYVSRNWTLFSLKFDSKKLNIFLKYDSKNWNLLKYDSENWTLLKHDSKNSTFRNYEWVQELNLRFNMTQRIEPFLECDSKNWTFWIRLNELNPFFFKKKKNSKNWTFLECDSKNWAFFFQMWLTELSPCLWLKELNLFFFLKTTQKYDSKNWTFFQYDSKILFNTTQRIEHFFFEYDSKIRT